MDKRIKKIFTLIIISMSFSSFAQTDKGQDVQHQVDELMKAQQEMIKSLFNDSGFQNFDKQFEDLVDKFEKNNFNAGPDLDDGTVVGEYDWRETTTHQILVLKVKQVKNKPLDIKIEKGQIKLKGDVESVTPKNAKVKSVTKVHFERSFSIPNDVDQTSPEFENKGGELLIKFKKLKPSKVKPHVESTGPSDQRLPVSKDIDDITI